MNADLLESWKNPKLRKKSAIEHPSGRSFQELSLAEIEAVSGGNGSVQPNSTPLISLTISGVVSFTASAAFKCRD